MLPQNDDPLPVVPPVKNRPPRIVPTTTHPARLFEFSLDPSCKAPTVEAVVEDSDVEDSIRVRWSVYKDDGTRGSMQIDQSIVEPAGVVRRSITASSLLFQVTDLAQTGTARQLELLVADGELKIEGDKVTAQPRIVPFADSGTTLDQSYIDSYTWIVNTTRNPCFP
ncbi:MAG: hypothetical protein IPJ65_32640 [Archangiaceae bacterium]|nr:hypothetical protein [Archangiaceae bacterium]